MAKLATPPTDDTPEAAVGALVSPVELLAMLTSGATFGGVAVRSVRIELADGRVQRLELAEIEADGGRPLSKLADRLLDVLRDMPDGEWTSGAALARMADPSGDLEHHSGTFKRAVDDLRKARLIETGRKGYRAK